MKEIIIILLFGFLGISSKLSATTLADSLRATKPSQTKLTLAAELSLRPGGDYEVEKDGEIIEWGESDFYSKASVRASMPLYQRGRTMVNASIRYSHIHQHFKPKTQLLDYGFGATAHHIFSANVMGMGRVRLGRKSLMLMGMVNGECSQYGFERWMAMGTAVVMLKETRRTQFGIGLLGMVNTFSRIPVFPFFTYRHTINNRWLLNFVLPNMQVCYTPSRTDVLSLGISIDVDHFFLRPKTDGLPDRVRYSRSVQNFGITYEHRFASSLSVTADLGLSLLMTDRINRSGSSSKIAEVEEKTSSYFKLGLQKKF